MNTRSAWRIEPNSATLPEESTVLLDSLDGMLQGRIEARRPERGLHAIRIGGKELRDWRLLAPQLSRPQHPSLSLSDCYARGADLIASYVEESERLRREIYWRTLEHPPLRAGGVELILSVQTSLLHSQPQLEIESRISAGQLGRMLDDGEFEFSGASGKLACTPNRGPGVFLLRPPGADFSYAEMIHPSDFETDTISLEEDHTEIVHALFPESLEKGVIRRGRVRAWFVARDGDTAAAAEFYREWLSEPPPLTT